MKKMASNGFTLIELLMATAVLSIGMGGMSALMLANAWVFEVIRYIGAGYLLWLAIKSLRRAWSGQLPNMPTTGKGRLFLKGYLLHITNPKAILAWGAIYAIVAIGFNIIYNTTGIINFAQGEFVMLGGMIACCMTACVAGLMYGLLG